MLAIIGSGSRLADAVGRAVSSKIQVRILGRSPGFFSPEDVVHVADYAQIATSALEGTTTVLNCVGTATASTSEELNQVNVNIACNALAAATRAGASHFIQLSSLSVYGAAEHIDHKTPERPVSTYGRAKLAADRLISSAGQTGPTVTILRLPMLYGKHPGEKLARLAKFMLSRGVFPAPSTLPERSILHYNNAAYVVSEIIRDPEPGIVLAAEPAPFTVADLATAVERKRGRKVHLIRLPLIAFVPLRAVSKSIYHSLYRSSVIAPTSLLPKCWDLPIPMSEGLFDVVP